MMWCIYCLCDLPPESFRGTEHVIPQSMGTFENNLTLNDLVCDKCNQYFGNTIDLMLGRGSAEAVRRFEYGVQPAGKVRGLMRDRVRFFLKRSDVWDGLLFELVPEGGSLTVKPVPQVGFRKSSENGFIFVSEDHLSREDTPLPAGPYAEGGLLVVGDSDAMRERLIAALQRRGITFRRDRQAPVPAQPGEMLNMEMRRQLRQPRASLRREDRLQLSGLL